MAPTRITSEEETIKSVSSPLLANRLTGIYGFGILFAANLLSGAALSLIASQRWSILTTSLIVFIVIYIQWLNFGTTIAKLGLDVYVFASITHDPTLAFELAQFWLRYTIPIAACFSIVAYTAFGLAAALACWIIVSFESLSVILAAEQNARGLYLRSAVSALFRYPLFFVLLGTAALFVPPTQNVILLLLICSSGLRLIITRYNTIRPPEAVNRVRYRPTLQAAGQYPLNYLLFRFDQVMLTAFIAHNGMLGWAGSFISEYAFLAKWPDLISGITSSAAIVLFPRFPIKPNQKLTPVAIKTKALLAALAYIALLAAGTAVYSLAWKTGGIPFALLIPFVAQAVLIVPANLVTYSMLRSDRLGGVFCRLAGIVAASGIVMGFAILLGWPYVYAYIVPCGLIAYVLSAYLFPWGKEKPVYEVSSSIQNPSY